MRLYRLQQCSVSLFYLHQLELENHKIMSDYVRIYYNGGFFNGQVYLWGKQAYRLIGAAAQTLFTGTQEVILHHSAHRRQTEPLPSWHWYTSARTYGKAHRTTETVARYYNLRI